MIGKVVIGEAWRRGFEITGAPKKGGWALVYPSQVVGVQLNVAIKMIKPEMAQDEKAKARFRREIRAHSNLTHPNIVSIYDFGEYDGHLFYVMEWVEGGTLRELLPEIKGDEHAIHLYFDQLCEALRYAHSKGIVHRDIKPENILFDARGTLKLSDFGLCVFLERNTPAITRSGEQIGTPEYWSPEQRQDPSKVDQRADIYSLGVTLYEMFTGTVPTPMATFQGIPEPFRRVVRKMLQPDPANRHASIDALINEASSLFSLLGEVETYKDPNERFNELMAQYNSKQHLSSPELLELEGLFRMNRTWTEFYLENFGKIPKKLLKDLAQSDQIDFEELVRNYDERVEDYTAELPFPFAALDTFAITYLQLLPLLSSQDLRKMLYARILQMGVRFNRFYVQGRFQQLIQNTSKTEDILTIIEVLRECGWGVANMIERLLQGSLNPRLRRGLEQLKEEVASARAEQEMDEIPF